MAKTAAASQVQVLEDTSWERLKASWLNKVLVLLPPWAVTVLLAWAAARFHALWGTGRWAPGAVAGMAVCVLLLTTLTWLVSRQRGAVGRVHAAVTTLAAGAWVCAATLTGVSAPLTGYLLITGGMTICLSWDIRVVIRQHAWDAENAGGDRITRWFRSIADDAGLSGAEMRVRKVSPRKVVGIFQLLPGKQTADDVIKATRKVESGLQFPPGSVLPAPNLDRADQAHFTITDPRILRDPLPWPGPSRAGASIADPIRVGLWQDQEEVQWTIQEHHKQIMGMTGSGKSIAAWSYLAEVITRNDAAVLGADITKGEQTLGPLREALHKFETSQDRAQVLTAAITAAVRPRTDFLASKGLQKWQVGCGLSYVVAWFEECPDILDSLGPKGLKKFLSMLKAARSAGVEVVLSLQRSDWTQMPTLARGQLANWCFGVATGDDASFGLSEVQDDRECRPELWANKQPGMAYLDAPSIPDERIAMPLRTWFWGDDDSKIRAHAEKYPASGRPMDAITAEVLNRVYSDPATAIAVLTDDDEDEQAPASSAVTDDDGETPEDVIRDYTDPDPDPDMQGGIDDPIEMPEGAEDIEFPPPPRTMTPDEARAAFAAQIEAWRQEGRPDFRTADLGEVLESTGLSRSWLHKQLNIACREHLIERIDDAERGRFGRYAILPPAGA
jgi:hypothetical protein